ncbi:MAG: NAD(P)/FAD-dependent oxidoreductase [Candidatus Paceibacterota bacterium]|jgi:hypothetical protein
MEKQKNFDVIVIGGGPAGMMAAIRAAELGLDVAILEKNSILGKKLLLTGDGRCNLSHIGLTNKELASMYGREGDFLLSPLSNFGVKETMSFFNDLGVELKSEKDGRVFPKSDKSQDILQALIKKIKTSKIKILTNAEVIKIEKPQQIIRSVTLSNGEKLTADKYIITTGGKAYPITGSTGDGFVWSEKMGHTIIKPRATLVPIQVKESWVKKLPGLSFENVRASLMSNGKLIKKQIGGILFAHFGLTGPLILDLSKEIGLAIGSGKPKLLIDLFPQKTQEQLEKDFQKIVEKNPNMKLKNVLAKIIPEKIVQYLVYFAGLKEDIKGYEVTKEMRGRLIKLLKKIEFNVVSLVGFDRAMATTGGVSLKEIDSKTMKSKLVDNLYFAGEVINLDGPCGGYNLQMCWTTGYAAGSQN